MNIKQLKIKDFLSHADTKLELKAEQKTLLDGASGSGKSSLVDAILWGLYGKGRADNRSLIRKGCETAEVTLILQDEKVEYKIERKITTAGKHDLKLSCKKVKAFSPVKVNGIKETQDYIEREIVKCSYILFVNSVLYPQDTQDSFVKQTASKRKDLIMEILKTEAYDDYYKSAKDKLKEAEDKILVSKTEVEVKEKNIEEDKLKVGNIKALEENVKKYDYTENEKEINRLLTEIATTQKSLESIKEKESKKTDLISSLTGLNTKLQIAKEKVEKIKNIDVANITQQYQLLLKVREELKSFDSIKESVDKWNAEYLKIIQSKPSQKDYESDIKDINKKLIAVLTEKLPVCKSCGAPYEEYEQKKKENQGFLEEQLEQKEKEKKEYDALMVEHDRALLNLGTAPVIDKDRISSLQQQELMLKEYELFYAQLSEREDRLKESIDMVLMYEKEIKDKNDEIAKLDNELKESSELRTKLQTLNTGLTHATIKRDSLKEASENAKNALNSAKEAQERINKAEEDIKALKANTESQRADIECLELIKDAFGSNGIRLLLIDYIIPQLEDRINQILSKLSNFSIRLETQRSSTAGDKMIEGLFITVINEQGEEMDFDSFSGGEKVRINFAIFEGLAGLQKCDFRILDEAILGLDEDTISNFYQVVDSLYNDNKQLLAITHIRQIKDLFSDIVNVVKINGVSKLC